MATYTNNLNLKKPNPEDFYNIADFNGNADILDTEIDKKANKVTGGILGNFVKLDGNGDIEDSGKSADDLTNAINKINALEEDFIEYLQSFGGFKKYTEAGTFTFKVPIGITSIKVSAIGGGGGGASGGSASTFSSGGSNCSGSGGGGGGRAAYIIDQSISVTPGETLTVTVGEGGSGGVGSGNATPYDDGGIAKYYGKYGNNGSDGSSSYVKRSDTILVTASRGTGGQKGGYGWPGSGGSGGSLDGRSGKSAYDDAEKGIGGKTDTFGIYGNGGDGSSGGKTPGYGSQNANSGTNGAVVICYGACDYNYVQW